MNKKIQAFLTQLGTYAFLMFCIIAPLYGAFYFFGKLINLIYGPK
jgi:hypothetical protein